MIAIVDYNMGNLASVQNAFAKLGCDTVIENDPQKFKEYDKLILPGVGAFGDAGMITTSDRELYEKLNLLRNYGAETKNYHVIRGYNARLDNLQGWVLNAKR